MTDPAALAPAPVAHALPAHPAPVSESTCRICSSEPAAQVTFRQHTGMLLLMRFGRFEGPFCRDCGLFVFRKATAHTLLAGWWGWLSFFITPVVIVINLVRRRAVAGLTAPVPRLDNRRPSDPGRPLYRRFAIAGVLVPLLVIGAIVAAAASSQPTRGPVGMCVQSGGTGTGVRLVDCGKPHQGVVTQVVDRSADCPVESIGVLTGHNSDGSEDSTKLCVGQG